MNDQDYVRAGARILGWEVRKSGTIIAAPIYFGHVDDQGIRDYMTAELVRQVDAAGKKANLYCEVLIHEMGQGECMDWPPDRTMNSIRAIVDSGVLE